MQGAAELLEPLYGELKKRVLGCNYIQIDETTIPVLDKDKPGATRKEYHWVVRSPELKSLFFHYDKGSRAQYVAVELLKDFRGAVQSDGYGAYDIYENKRRVLLLGCRAHIQRKFEHALDDDPERAEYALRLIGQLYAIERRVKEQGIPLDEIKAIREKKRSDMPMRYTRAWHATSQTADAASTITSRSKPYGRWHWAARTTSSAATTRRHTIRPLSTPCWGHADCVCGGAAVPPPSCNESRHSSPQGNLHKWVQDSIL